MQNFGGFNSQGTRSSVSIEKISPLWKLPAITTLHIRAIFAGMKFSLRSQLVSYRECYMGATTHMHASAKFKPTKYLRNRRAYHNCEILPPRKVPGIRYMFCCCEYFAPAYHVHVCMFVLTTMRMVTPHHVCIYCMFTHVGHPVMFWGICSAVDTCSIDFILQMRKLASVEWTSQP